MSESHEKVAGEAPSQFKLSSFGITDVGLRRSHNEDSFSRNDDLGLYLVADGMGGHAAGEVASQNAIETINEFVRKQADDSSVTWPFGFDARFSNQANALLNGIRMANQKVFDLQHSKTDLSGMGTTIAALRIEDDHAIIAHVGDSRAYRYRDNHLELLTSDHSWVNEQLQKQIITAEEARNHRYRNVITRALGNRLDLDIDARVEGLEPEDLFLLCSDGLSGMIDDVEIAGSLDPKGALREMANSLVAAANMAGGHDNISVVIVRVTRI
jgi:serine/threonine protein phosphatase PrpC